MLAAIAACALLTSSRRCPLCNTIPTLHQQPSLLILVMRPRVLWPSTGLRAPFLDRRARHHHPSHPSRRPVGFWTTWRARSTSKGGATWASHVSTRTHVWSKTHCEQGRVTCASSVSTMRGSLDVIPFCARAIKQHVSRNEEEQEEPRFGDAGRNRRVEEH